MRTVWDPLELSEVVPTVLFGQEKWKQNGPLAKRDYLIGDGSLLADKFNNIIKT